MALEIPIPVDEWEAARRASVVVDEDERQPIGQVRLRSDGVRRTWTATDRVRGVVLTGGPDANVYDVCLSPALIEHAAFTADEDGDGPTLVVTERDGIEYLVVNGPAGSMWHRRLDHVAPDIEAFVADDDEIIGRASVIAADLYYALHAASRPREGSDDDGSGRIATFWMAIDGDDLLIGADWDECGRSLVNVVATDVAGNVVVEIDPELLRTVIDQFAPGTRLDVRIPASNLLPVLFRSDDRTTMLMPMSTPARRLRASVESLLVDTFGDLALDRDDNGDYRLTRRRVPVRARLVTETEPPVLTLFSTVVDDVEPSADLLRELNDLNVQTSFASVTWAEGAVVARVDLVAETVDPDELVVAARRIHQLAIEVAPTIAVVLGGNVVEDPAVARFRHYRATVIEAEIAPGRMVPITGPDAVSEWPFPGTVHVITGYDPQGVTRDRGVNEEVNRAIAGAVLEEGGRFVHGAGTAADGSHSEPSLVVWGLDRDVAVDMGWRADQDAVFEIDALEMRLCSCTDDRVEAWPRRAASGPDRS